MTTPTRQAGVLLAAVAVLAGVEWIDYRTGYEIGLFALYALPIGWVAWTCGMGPGMGLVAVDTIVRVWTETGFLHKYGRAWIAWETGAIHLILLLFIAYSFNHFQKGFARKDNEAKRLKGVLPICFACNRIQDASGRWIEMETFLREFSQARTEPRLCPNCGGPHRPGNPVLSS